MDLNIALKKMKNRVFLPFWWDFLTDNLWLISIPLTRVSVYHVGPNGWTQVWAGDTTDMFYKYYPIKDSKSVETESEKKAQEAAAMSFGHGA